MVIKADIGKIFCDLPKISIILLILDFTIFKCSENVNYLIYVSTPPPAEELSNLRGVKSTCMANRFLGTASSFFSQIS